MKNILLSILILTLGFVACSDDDNTDNRIELASPKPTVKTNLATATFSWPEIDKTGGYAYALDDSEDYTFLGVDELEVTISGIYKGPHIFKIYAVGVDGKSTDSAIRQLEFNVDPAIPSPSFTYTAGDGDGEVIVTWNAIEGASGYAYRLNETGEWIEVGADVLTATLTGIDFKVKTLFSLKALGNPPTSEDSEEFTDYIDMKTATGLWVITQSSKAVELTETATGTEIYTTTISCSASDAFYINIENEKYGFMSYSGNGGVGTINSVFAAAPFYNKGVYYIRESNGLMSTGDAINNFYVNVSGDCKVFVQINMNGETPSYYLKLEDSNPDTSIVLAQYFDLLAYGGDWVNYYKGTGYPDGSTIAPTHTGLSAGVKNGANSGTVFGAAWLQQDDFPSEYVKNRGMEGWSFENVFEFPGYIRLSNTNATNPLYGVLTTPKLGAAGNMEVTFDGLLFAALRDAGTFIEVKVLNGGKITSAKVVKDSEGSPITIQPAGNDAFHITSSYHTDYANAAAKKWSNYTFTIENATADTQIIWNCKTNASVASSQYRYCLDNIIVKKK